MRGTLQNRHFHPNPNPLPRTGEGVTQRSPPYRGTGQAIGGMSMGLLSCASALEELWRSCKEMVLSRGQLALQLTGRRWDAAPLRLASMWCRRGYLRGYSRSRQAWSPDGVGKIVLLGGAQGGAGVYEQVDEGVYVGALVGSIGLFQGETQHPCQLFEASTEPLRYR